ncbi:MAG TPA: site-specific integrase [Candidatus Aquilonibacter sp.]|nr:site-specific integrase [Candidatus Aquilonibacter sp.]
MRPFTASTETKVLEELNAKLQGRKAEIAKWEDEKNPPLSVGQTWSVFLASPNRPDSGDSTLRQYEFQWQAFADWIQEKHADILALREVSQEIAEEYASNLNHEKFSPSTYNKHLNLLTLVFRVLKHKAKLTGNPWEDIQRKRLVTNSRRELTIDELRKVCQAATGELKTLLALGIYSGLRLGDCATLRWGEVDLPRRMIRRIPNKTARRNPKPVIIPIHPILCEMLSETPLDKRGEYVLPELATLYNHRTDMVTDMVQRHFKACGITLHKPGTGTDGKRAVIEVGFHSLRHTFVSLCRESNAPLAVVESIVGHSNPSMTRHYTHVGELAAGRAVALLPSVMSESTPEQPKLEPSRILREVQNLAKSITAKNWRKQKSAILITLAGENFGNG